RCRILRRGQRRQRTVQDEGETRAGREGGREARSGILRKHDDSLHPGCFDCSRHLSEVHALSVVAGSDGHFQLWMEGGAVAKGRTKGWLMRATDRFFSVGRALSSTCTVAARSSASAEFVEFRESGA